ncbi:unnamed protein product [Linum tenue]|uniref:HMA domain-containing protein n=1 Tax=Linum tenue TaxID=586396 RepID=A0AAV0PVM7_9ROSI|nr:unnamed protein product [Linum tenue]
MKRMEFLCSSPSSTAICSSLDHRSMVRHSTATSSKQPIFGTCSSHEFFPVNPSKQRRSTSVVLSDLYKHPSSVSDSKKQSTPFDSRRRTSSADPRDLLLQLRRRQQHIRLGSSTHLLSSDDRTGAPPDWVSDSAPVPNPDRNQMWPNRPKETTSAGGYVPVTERGHRHSSVSELARSDDPVFSDSGRFSGMVVATTRHSKPNRSESSDEITSDKHVVSAVAPAQARTPRRVSFQDCPPVLKSSSSARSHDQVVVLRVSIHCKGCEGKVRKHISKMEGVTSFSIDLATKQVIVKGKVTPLGVLASISKVKTAQLWATSSSLLHPTPSTSAPPPPAAAAPRWST